jgi:guanylate kinase
MMIRPIVISGPSGGGKSTILKAVMQRFHDAFAFSVSRKLCDKILSLTEQLADTTRSPRPGESDGHDYWFTTIDKMKSMINAGEFLEYAEFGNNLYGTR